MKVTKAEMTQLNPAAQFWQVKNASARSSSFYCCKDDNNKKAPLVELISIDLLSVTRITCEHYHLHSLIE